ncbi:MAG: tRNA delta(2)-isopentenylpyrophosphate transferase, tRNA dimethylallyltransferase [Candidatus Gottesmanbacteria bacterium GW2011_GWA2_43_14]|uniref:tRNA delta(2)-isopentenylpyrophosphate transferase, tRNA dimethylallyltransferase n=1 Tax=Candidatus Gottesmanbacteria bacterium GW2011_GWA2_43_14 TaxID=1618443 RepID=A0A0G1FM20_9BACT|nr:MAG: tRNA delta(2)-isopentenylpyrophosphate transferase, tRNA dimethylallyltransferase [Candidatus Gottesmanbacteria bacterium GW2011_GWA2_43_14]
MDIGTGKDIPKNSNFRITPGVIQDSQSGILNHQDIKIGYYLIDGIPLWLVDIVKPDFNFHLSLYRRLALAVIADISRRGKLPLVVGGTGLYIKSLLTDMPDMEILPDADLRQQLSGKNSNELGEILRARDFVKWQKMNVSDRQNPRRLVRAIEVAGKRPAEKTILPVFDFLMVYLKGPKTWLDDRIKKRVAERISAGVVAETDNLIKDGYDFNLPSFSASPYRQLAAYFTGGKKPELLDQALNNWQKAEKDYAQRQTVWFDKMARQFSAPGKVMEVDASKINRKQLEVEIGEWYTKRRA